MGIHDFFDRFNLDQDEVDEDYNTVSGWVIDHLGRFAELGDHFSYDKVDVSVSKASEYVVEQLEVSYHPRRKKKKD
jgi:CBS domain containing-hemolysin-like protein